MGYRTKSRQETSDPVQTRLGWNEVGMSGTTRTMTDVLIFDSDHHWQVVNHANLKSESLMSI